VLNGDLENFKKVWTVQLYREFDDICFRFRLPLQRPLIRVMDFTSRWGHWDADTRTLALASRLITDNSWAHVLEIFKHELAHQYVDEVLGLFDQHGMHFKHACEKLGVEAWAQKAEVHSADLLSTLSKPVPNPEQEALFRKIERLLALARSSNEHEAVAAMNKVSELHEKYHLAQLKTDQLEEFTTVVIDHKLRRLPSFHGILSSILTSYFSVRVIFSTLYDKEKLSEFKVIEILGRVDDVQLAEYVYWFLFNTMDILWSHYQEQTKSRGLAAKNSYYLGVLNGFETKMKESKKSRSTQTHLASQEKSLIALGEKRLDEYAHYKHPRLHTVRSTQTGRNSKIFQDGIAKGKELTIHSGIKDSKPGDKMKLLNRSNT